MISTPTIKTYDAVIAGSGAGGGIAAQVLATAGAKVCMLEAGAWYDCTKDSKMFQWSYQAPHRGAPTHEMPLGYFDATLLGGWEVPGEPYVNAPGSDWHWWRARMLGGRTNHYGRISLRMGEYDFKPYSRDGKGFDWPISYKDLAPYYDKAEELVGVFGTEEGIENAPDGKFQPAPAPRGYERVLKLVQCPTNSWTLERVQRILRHASSNARADRIRGATEADRTVVGGAGNATTGSASRPHRSGGWAGQIGSGDCG